MSHINLSKEPKKFTWKNIFSPGKVLIFTVIAGVLLGMHIQSNRPKSDQMVADTDQTVNPVPPANAATNPAPAAPAPSEEEEEVVEQAKPFKITCKDSQHKVIYARNADSVDVGDGAAYMKVVLTGETDEEAFVVFPGGIYCVFGVRGKL